MVSRQVEPADEGVRGELHKDQFVGATDLVRWHSHAGRSLVNLVQKISTKLGPRATLIYTLLAGALTVAGLSFIFANLYESVTEGNGVAGLDQPVLVAAKSIRSPLMDVLATAYTDVGGDIGMPIFALVTMAVLGIRRKSWTPVILITIAGGGSLLMITAGKHFIGRSRPPLQDAVPPFEHSAAFPSGHALGSVVIAGIVAYLMVLRLVSSRARFWAIVTAVLFAVTMGLSRLYLGHHWLTDVLAAWALGTSWLIFVITAHRLYLTVSWARRPRRLSGQHE